jgi:hypothetical protein
VHVTARTGIACPPEQVFDMVADLRNETRSSSRVSSAQLRSAEPIQLGSRFAIVNGGTAYEVTTTVFVRDQVPHANEQVTIALAQRDEDKTLDQGTRLRAPACATAP